MNSNVITKQKWKNIISSEHDHTSDRLTDLHDPKSPTWWQSETIYEGIQYPTAVNLTLNLGITNYFFAISHQILTFFFFMIIMLCSCEQFRH